MHLEQQSVLIVADHIQYHTNLTVIEMYRAHPRQLLASKIVAKHKIHSLVTLVGTPSPTSALL